MRTARAVPTPCDCRKTMMSRTALCCRQPSWMRWMRRGPMPLTSRKNDGLSSMTASVRSPKTFTISRARRGPMPLTRPEPRYFSTPSTVCGGVQRSSSALNCSPCSRSWTQAPTASTYSPAVTDAMVPTTAVRPRRPRACTRSTAKPVSGLWKVTRSTTPDSCSAISPIVPPLGRKLDAGRAGRRPLDIGGVGFPLAPLVLKQSLGTPTAKLRFASGP